MDSGLDVTQFVPPNKQGGYGNELTKKTGRWLEFINVSPCSYIYVQNIYISA